VPVRVDDVAFLVLPERAPVQFANSHDVISTLFPNFDQYANLS
jgi:hypothetical protein